MSPSKPLQRLKGFFHRGSSKRGEPTARDNQSPSAPASFEEAGASVAAVSQSSSSRPLQTTETLAFATPGRAPSPTARPITSLPQMIPPPSEDMPSLWSRAYKALREKDAQLVERYEILLSQELEEQEPSAPEMQGLLQQHDSEYRHDNRINPNPNKRYAQLKTITDRGLQRADDKRTRYTIFGHQFVLEDQVQQTTRFMLTIKGLVDEAVKVSPEASLAWAGVCVLLPVFTKPIAAEEANRDGLLYVTSRLGYYVELECLLWPRPLANPGLKVKFDDHVIELYQRILEFQIKTVLRFYKKWVKKLVSDIIQPDEWKAMLSKIEKQEQIVRDESNHLQSVASGRTLQDISKAAQQNYNNMRSLLSINERLLDEQMRTNQILQSRPLDLPVVNEARYDSGDFQDGPRCESGTRVRIQETIYNWADDNFGEPFFWLVGPAGTGKSTVARTITDSWAKRKRLAAGYFFKRGEKGRNDTNRLFATIAVQLADTIPCFQEHLRRSIDGLDRDAIEERGLQTQFDKLIKKPLEALVSINTSHHPMIIIIDALDECERPDHLSQVITLLDELRDIRTVRFRVLFTSRSAREVNAAFEPLIEHGNARKLELHRVFFEDTKSDIQTFLTVKFAEIKTVCKVQQDPWPADEELARMVQMATTPEPLFIYAATLCRFVYDEKRPSNPKKQLKLWLKQCEEGKPQLHQIYDPILSRILLSDEEADSGQQLQFLGALVLLATPLSAVSLTALLGLDIDDVNWWLLELHAVLDIPPEPHRPIRLLHKSFSDFLLNSETTGTSKHSINATETHAMLAIKCIQRMREGLQQDICNIQKPAVLRAEIDKQVLNTHIPADLRYACLYWVYHLQQSKGSLGDDVYVFLTTHLLHWLEVLGLLGNAWDGVAAIKQLLKICQEDPHTPAELREFITDATNVVASFASMIEQTPLQIYAALILFCPVTSKVRERYWNQRLPNLPCVHGVKSNWDALRQTLEGHTDWVNAVAFSRDGQVVASASRDNTVRLWDAATGAPRQTLEGHTDWVRAVAFSRDGQVVASASDDSTVRLWDAATGAPQQTLEGHTTWVNAVAFSRDGQVVASASRDNTVRLWDAATGAPRQTLEGFTQNLAFDPCSRNRLLTDFGVVDVVTGSLTAEPYPRVETPSSSAGRGPGINPDRIWIMEGGKKIIWLPIEYRPTASAIRGTIMFLGCASGRVMHISATSQYP